MKFAYVWLARVLEERFGFNFTLQPQPDNTLRITLGSDSPHLELPLDAATFTSAHSDLPCTEWNAVAEGWQSALDPILLAPGACALPSPLIEPTAHGHRIHYDILGLTYWMLSRQEEVGRTDLDSHGRFPATSSHAYKHGYLERPIVDEWLHILGQVIQRTWLGIALKQHKFSIKVSHDVDSPSLYGFKSWSTIGRMMAGHALKRCDMVAFSVAPWVKLMTKGKLHHADPHNTFDWLMDLSEANNLISAFYFLAGRTSNMDGDYDLGHSAIRALMRRIHQRGHEIGLHPSYGTYQKSDLVAQEVRRLQKILTEENIQQSAIGGRMHYLRWEQPTTLQAVNDAGMTYDTTLGYADKPGFRCGTCFEYPAFNPQTQQALNIRIRPLVVMECTVIDGVYLGLGCSQAAEDKILELKAKIRVLKGCFTILWHNSYFANDQGLMAMYLRIIKH